MIGFDYFVDIDGQCCILSKKPVVLGLGDPHEIMFPISKLIYDLIVIPRAHVLESTLFKNPKFPSFKSFKFLKIILQRTQTYE